MRIAFRVDAAYEMGTGHFYRCLTLADALAAVGDQCCFICRGLPEALQQRLRENGHLLLVLPNAAIPFSARSCDNAHAAWLGTVWEDDAGATSQCLKIYGGADWLVVDHYALDSRWELCVAADVARIMVIDDLADRPHLCSILLDQSRLDVQTQWYRSLVPPACELLIGPHYALLRNEFSAGRRSGVRQRDAVGRILVFLGGTDPTNFTAVAVEAISLIKPPISADIVIGSGHRQRDAIAAACATDRRVSLHCDVDHMAELMARADLAIGAGGTSSWERLCMGLPSLVVTLSKNQAAVNASLAEGGFVRLLGSATDVTAEMLASAVTGLLEEPYELAQMSVAAMRLVDGCGTRRVVKAMHDAPLSLRLACKEDVEDLLAWRNDPATRKHSMDSRVVAHTDHLIWFSATLHNPESRLLVGTIGSDKVGTVRFDLMDRSRDQYRISITVNPVWRGLGIGTALLREACRLNAPCSVVAEIKDGNAASDRMFRACGFRLSGHDVKLGQSSYTAEFPA